MGIGSHYLEGGKMSQRNSRYDRRDRELYPTPVWVAHALKPYIPSRIIEIWEPAAGDGSLMNGLIGGDRIIWGSDIAPSDAHINQLDFLTGKPKHLMLNAAIITNPPYGAQGKLAEKFITKSLDIVEPLNGFVAMLLRVDFDSAKTRRNIFSDCRAWTGKIVLTRRIKWFDTPGNVYGPSENHAWFLWDFENRVDPTIRYYFG
jgi:hypothetical protein